MAHGIRTGVMDAGLRHRCLTRWRDTGPRRLLLGAGVGFLLFTGLACGAATLLPANPGPDRDLAAGRGIYWGASIGPQLTGAPSPTDPKAITAFEREMGKQLSIVQMGWQFARCDSQGCRPYAFPESDLKTIRNAGAIPLVSLGTTAAGGSQYDQDFTLASIADGQWDGFLVRYAAQVKAWGHPFFLRLDWEMNGTVWPWDPGNNGSTPATYVAAWRHIHDVFGSAGVRNVTWVWCPNIGATQNLRALYPGSRYVDWSCLDGYNYGGTASVSFLSWDALFSKSYDLITNQLAPGKPMMVAEFGSTSQGGDKAAWITNALAEVPYRYSDIRALVYYDVATQGANWSLETSPHVLGAVRRGISARVYVTRDLGPLGGGVIKPPRLRGSS